MGSLDQEIYTAVSRYPEGLNVAAIAGILRADSYDVRRVLSSSPLIHELCYTNARGCYCSLISGTAPHTGLEHFSACYTTVGRLHDMQESVFMERIEEQIRAGRTGGSAAVRNRKNLKMLRCTVLGMITDLRIRSDEDPAAPEGLTRDRLRNWEIVFYPDVSVSGSALHCASDVLLITERYVFAFNFLVSSRQSDRQLLKLYALAGDFSVIFGPEYRITVPLVMKRGTGQLLKKEIKNEKTGCSVILPVCSRDMMYRVVDDSLHFLKA